MDQYPPRPKVSDEMKLEAARALCKEASWNESNAKHIADCFRLGMDGFELCKELDRRFDWDTSRDDMEVLDGMEQRVDDLLEAAERQWFEENRIVPPLADGTRIRVKNATNITGTVAGIYKHGVAKFLIKEDGCTNDSRHVIVKFEDAEVLPA